MQAATSFGEPFSGSWPDSGEPACRHGLRCLRAVLTACLLAVVLMDPASPASWLIPVLGLHALYALMALVRGLHAGDGERVAPRWEHGVDAAVCAVLTLGDAPQPFLFALWLLPICAAAAHHGLLDALAIALLSALAGFGAQARRPLDAESTDPLWIAPSLALAAVALVLAGWAAHRRRTTELARSLEAFAAQPCPLDADADPLADGVIALREALGADLCVCAIGGANGRLLVSDQPSESRTMSDRTSLELANELLALDPSRTIQVTPAWWARGSGSVSVRIDPPPPAAERRRIERAAIALSESLGERAWLSLPIPLADGQPVRLYATLPPRRARPLDVATLTRHARAIAAAVGLAQRMTDRIRAAAVSERLRISLDLHDSSIQPYLGLKLGIESIRRKLPDGDPIARELDDLSEMTSLSVLEMRQYVHALSTQRARRDGALAVEIRRQVDRLAKLHKLRIDVDGVEHVDDCIGVEADLLRILAEGVANVARHSSSPCVQVSFRREPKALLVQITDEGRADAATWVPFWPGSIAQRAGRLGGTVDVTRAPGGSGSVVAVRLPQHRDPNLVAAV